LRMDRNFFDKLYNKMVDRRFLTKPKRRAFLELNSGFGKANFSFDEISIEDIFIQFFLHFFVRLKDLSDLSDAGIKSIMEFINFPEGTKIEVFREFNKEEILKETETAAVIAMAYFSENLNRSFSEFMQEYIEEAQIHALSEISAQGNIFKLSSRGRKVFDHKVKLHSRFADDRMQVRKESGAEQLWTPELRDKVLKRFEELKERFIKAKNSFSEEKNGVARRRKIRETFSELTDEIIDRLLTGGANHTPRQIALELLREELSSTEPFRVDSFSYVEGILKRARSERRKRAA
jgi:hypothetical protein